MNWMRTRLTAAVAGAVVACVPASAQAGLPGGLQETADTWASCHAPAIEQPFLAYGDALDYVLAPSGSFEGSADGWKLRCGADVVGGNDPFALRSGTDAQVLSLSGGGSATSPVMCVDLNFPSFRLAVADLADRGKLRVRVMYPDAPDPQWLSAASLDSAQSDWSLSDHLPLQPEAGGAEPGARRVALRFQTQGGGEYLIDDVYVDPRSRN